MTDEKKTAGEIAEETFAKAEGKTEAEAITELVEGNTEGPGVDDLLRAAASLEKADEGLIRELERLTAEAKERTAKRHEAAAGLSRSITKPLEDRLSLYTCECGKSHFRHAGYVKPMIPFMQPDGAAKTIVEDRQVMVCVVCKRSYTYVDGKMYEVTDQIDLNAWQRSEVELQAATGPGGQC